ncbi:glycosyltransferase family 2 protein [Nitrosopumilus sp.]|uniref:glycosyltransferase family 2 protein n=1 Tax=Nitrosopumilus sp. TaxID=2024843 RepID=UPI003D0BB9BF
MAEENQKSLVSIIILNYNASNLLIDCIESIMKSNYKKFEIILVDNASTDKSHIKCKEKFPNVKLIENNKNLGYCEGNNIGIKETKGEFLVILNPDTIVDPYWLDELISAYHQNGEGLYQPKFLTTTDQKRLMSTGNQIQLFGFGFSRGKGEKDSNQFNQIELIGYASGTCLFSKTDLIKKLEMFDSFLFAYHDDLDLGWRASLEKINSYYVPKSIVFHPSEGFAFHWSKFKYFLLERNRLYCIFTHYSHSTIFKLLPSLILVDFAVSIFYLRKHMFKEKIKASLNILKNLGTINKKYIKIQNKRKINDAELIKKFTDHIDIPKEIQINSQEKSFYNFLKKLSEIARSCV